VDIDRFSTMNQVWGHATSDDVLMVVASRLRAAVRPEDVVARLGSDRFGAVVACAPGVEAQAVARRIHEALESPAAVEAGDVPVRVSVGVAARESPEETAASLLSVAGEALAVAKAEGGGRVSVLGPEARAKLGERVRLEGELHSAIERDEFRWHYQPVVDLSSGAVRGVEALLRWQHPQRGLLAPDAFLDVAQRGGLMPAIGRRTLARACRKLVEWSARLPAFAGTNVAVNVSAPELRDDGLVESVRTALAESELPAWRLLLEITETSLIVEDSTVVSQLAALRAVGVPLALDDFGTGYSSLSHLRTFPVQVLKVDRSFVSVPDGGAGDARLTPGIIRLARDIDLDVVAEGIETAQQSELLRTFGAQYGQGYFSSRPLPPDRFEEWCRATAHPRRRSWRPRRLATSGV
jgi:diguanylate cyclase (GGDEF)-like protein